MFSDIKFKVTHLGVKGGAEDEAFETQRKAFEKYEKTLRALVKSLEKLEKAFKGTLRSSTRVLALDASAVTHHTTHPCADLPGSFQQFSGALAT